MSQTQKFLLILGLLLFYTFSFLFQTDYALDQDLGRHLRLGEIISRSLSVPQTNVFSYTFPNFSFINHHHLFETLIFEGQKVVGLEGLLVIKILLILMSVTFLFLIIKRGKYLLALPIGYIFLHVLRSRIELRPEVLSFFFTALTFYILEEFDRKKSRLIILLPLIQLVWVNSHIYFPLGIGLQAVYLISFIWVKERKKAKLTGLLLGFSALATLINPNFLTGALYPLRIFNNYGYTIAENQTMFLLESLNFHDPNFLFVKISAGLILLSMAFALFNKNLTLKNSLLCLFGLGLALMNVRGFPYLIFISLPPTIANFSAIKKSWWTRVATFATVCLLLFESTFYLSGDYYKSTDRDIQPTLAAGEHAKEALDFALENSLPQPIFNNFDIGSYIIYRGYPSYQVFVDGRPEAYPAAFFQDEYIPMQNDPKMFEKIDQKFSFKTIIFSQTDQTPWGRTFLGSIIKNPGWKTVYLDDSMIILVKNEVAQQKKLKPLDLASLSSEKYQFDNHASYLKIGVFLLNTGYSNAAKTFTQKALALSPDSPTANLIMANLYSKGDDIFSLPLAQKYYQKSQSWVWW